MPFDRTDRADGLDFREAFLDTVLPEVALARGGSGENILNGKGLGNGDETDLAGSAVGVMRRRIDPAAHLGET